MIDINEFDAINIGLASPEQIRAWSSGEVTKPETINYRTLKPEKDGLFCEKIFGPTKDWECYCGKYKRVRYKGIICERCGVEVTRAKVRRERMGHIDLAAPVSHIWYFKGVPSRMGYLLDISPKRLERVLYFSASIVTSVDEDKREHDRAEPAIKVVYWTDDTGAVFDELDAEADDRARDRSGQGLQRTESQMTLEERVNWDIDLLYAKRDRRKAKVMALRDRQVSVLMGNSTPEPDDEAALGLDEIPLEEWTAQEVEKKIQEIRDRATIDLRDLERYTEEQGERLRELWSTFRNLEKGEIITDETFFRDLKERFGSPFGYGVYFKGGMGAEAIRALLAAVDLENEAESLREIIKTSKGQRQSRAVKRLKVVEGFLRSDNRPEWMILEAIPVIPPELRPMVQLDGGRFATSDLNDLYRRVINRNNRLKRLLDLGAPEIIVNNEKRMLQEAVDALFDNGRRGRAVTGPGNRPLKSLSDMLKGKQGRFRQNLLGKRVDYSGRSVIVAGPELALHQAGIPKTMALELFKPFVMSRLVERRQVQNIKAAKKMVESEGPEVWDILEEVISEHPVLLNRAPTLHRLGIQAFEPVLIEGKAIQLHPLVCTAFNADFDGDQMAVHLPLSVEAQAEARVLMLSSNNILSPAHGRPVAVPTQDMILGCYYLTYYEGPDLESVDVSDAEALAAFRPKLKAFAEAAEVERVYAEHMAGLQDPILFRWDGQRIVTTIGRVILNSAVVDVLRQHFGEEWDGEGPNGESPRKLDYEYKNLVFTKKVMSDFVSDLVEYFGATAVAQLLDVLKDLGFHYATVAGVTISKNDIVVPPNKDEILQGYEEKVQVIQKEYLRGNLTEAERRERVRDLWNDATDDVAAAMMDNFRRLNPVYMMANSGARGSFKQIRQLAGMRGLMANPKGEIIERAIKSNFMEGLSVLEYFISTHGARKGLADTALRTADSGYLTRRLVDVAQDVVIRETDCGTEESILLWLRKDDRVNENLTGRLFGGDVADPTTGEIVFQRNDVVTKKAMRRLEGMFPIEQYPDLKLAVRSVLVCQSEFGVCQHCYGRSLATNELVSIGEAAGHIAAQSIGEPGTQLTMRTFHTGGVAGADITHGLPRVVELFEARKPKGQAKIIDSDLDPEREYHVEFDPPQTPKKVRIVDDLGVEAASYAVSRRMRLAVKDGQTVQAGDPLYEGPLNPHELLAFRGVLGTAQYLVSEVQKVYKSQGVDINDKHIELIARQMTKRVRIDASGDTDFLPGQMVERMAFERINAAVLEAGGEPATAEELLLGITKASLATDSFLSAASFQETTKVLTDAALEGKTDYLRGLKENIIIGKLIPAATGLRTYRNIEIMPTRKSVGQVVEALFGESDYERGDGDEGRPLSAEEAWAQLTGSGEDDGGEYADMSLDDLDLPTYIRSILSREDIETLGELLSWTPDRLLGISGFGHKSLEEVRARLAERGLDLLGAASQDDGGLEVPGGQGDEDAGGSR